MITIQPDNSLLSSISILRQKKQFVNKINFALNCILQSLRVTNPKYDDNITHILKDSLYKDLTLALQNYNDEEVCQQILSILLKIVSYKREVGVGISESNFFKGIEKNLTNVVKNVETIVALINKISNCDVNSNWIIQRDRILGNMIIVKMSDDNITHIINYVQFQNIKISKSQYFKALPFYKNKKIIKSLLYQIYKNIQNKVDRLSNTEMNQLLTLVDIYIGDCELCYIIYFILAKFYTFKQAVASNNENKLVLAYVYALGQANMQFQPAFTDQKSFIYTLAILSQGDRFTECYIKVLMPKFDMIKSEASELKFLSELKKIGLKDNIKQLYNPLRETLLKSKNPRLIRQYEYLLKNLNIKHDISKSKQTIIIDDSTFKIQKQFADYFISLLLLITLFEANLMNNETEKLLQQSLKFIKINRQLSNEYLPFLYQFVVKIQSEFIKNQSFHTLLTQIYIQCLQNDFKHNKIVRLEEIILRTFTLKGSTWNKQKDSVKLGVVIPTLVVNPPTFKEACKKLPSFTLALRNGEFKINTKLYLIFKLFNVCEYTNTINDVVVYFLQYLIEVFQKDKDSNKIKILEGIIKWIPKLEKNHIYVKLIANQTVQFLLERIFYILVSLIKTLQCDALFEIIFELEQWVPLQELMRKNQADKILCKSLENYSYHTADIIELCEVLFGEPDSEYYNKTASMREDIHKNIRSNLDKYTLEDLSAYDSSLILFGQFARKTKFQIKYPNPTLKQLQQRCNQFKPFNFYQQNPSEDSTILKVISQTFKDLVKLSGTPQAKGDLTLDLCARSILVSLTWAFQNSQIDIPIEILQNLNSLLNSPLVSSTFIKSSLQAIATLPHTFNLTKIPFEKLYQKHVDDIEILEVLNDLIKIVAQSSPKALNNLKFEPFIDQTFYFLVFERDSPLVQSKLKLIQTICLVDSRWNEFILSKIFVLQKIIKADLSNPTFYRPKIIEAILNIMDQLSLLKGLAFQLCKLFEKYIDESQICYMILLNLKQIPAQEVTSNLNQRSLAYILINSQDKDLIEMCKKLMIEYKEVDSNNQQQFVKAFTKKNYDKCEQLIHTIQKPHEVQFVKNQVNAFLSNNQVNQFPKMKQFIMTNKKAEPVLYECEAFYEDETLLNNFVQKFEEIDNQLQVFSIDINGEVESHKPSIDMNIEAIKQMIKKQNFIVKYVETILKGNPTEQLPKVKLICLLSKIPELTELCDIAPVKKLLDIQIYQPLFYNSGLSYSLYHQNQTNVLSLINHLQSHLIREDGSKTEQNQYMCKLLKEILNHKPKNKQYFITLMQIVPACKKVINSNNIDILTNMTHELLLLLHEGRKGLKFASTKEENYFNNLQLILVDFYQASMTFSDIHNVSLKTMDRLFSFCSSSFQSEIFVFILKRYLDNQSKDKDRQDVLERYPMQDKVDKFTQKGKFTYKSLQIQETQSQNQIKIEKITTFVTRKQDTEMNNDLASKQQTVQTIAQYSKIIESLIKNKDNKSNQNVQIIMEHLITISNNTFYYNKIVKQKLVQKLIHLYSTKPNNVLLLLMRISHNKSIDILKSELVVKFIKDRLKQILEQKPQNSEDLSRIMSIFDNSQYSTFDTYFKGGLYSTIIEILKAKVMEKNILTFINSFKMDERLVNELYQRGLIQFSIQKIGNSAKDEGQQWITLLGKICINPAIQNKLIGIKIHEEVFKKFKDSKKISIIQGCAIFFTNISFNNEAVVKWVIQNNIIKIYPNSKDLPDITMVQIIKNIYSVAYNNATGKKYLIEINIKQKLYDYFNQWKKGLKSSYLVPWNVCKTLSTLLLDPDFIQGFITDKFVEILIKQKIPFQQGEECFNQIELLHNLLATINKPKQYQQLKASNIFTLFRQVRKSESLFLLKHVEMLVVSTCLLVKWQLLDSKQIDVQDFEFVLRSIVKHDVSDELTKTTLTKLVQCLSSSKDVKVTSEIIFVLEKIARKRKTDIFMPMIVQIIENIKDIDIIRSVMSRGELGNMICDVYPQLSKDKNYQDHLTNCLIMMAASHWIADIIITYIGKQLLESPDISKLKILSALCEYTSTACFAIELNGITILGELLKKSPPVDQQYYLLKIGRQMFKCKDSNVSEKQLWTQGMNKIKPDTKSTQIINDLKLLFNNKKTTLTPQIKQQLTKGLLCSLYKTDGSVSKLLLTINKSLNEINCIHEGSSNVKPKWRVPINDIKQIVYYNQQAKFQKSHFYKSNFLGKKPQPERCLSIMAQNNELHILFPSKQAKQKWVSSLMLVQQYVSQMLLMLR